MKKLFFVTFLLFFSPIVCFGISYEDQISVTTAIAENDLPAFDRLLEKPVIKEYVRTEKNMLLLTAIFRSTSPEMLKRILAIEPDVNGLIHGMLPITTAAQMGKIDFMKVLLHAGADPTIKDHEGKDAFSHTIDMKTRMLLIKHFARQAKKRRHPLKRFLRLIIINDQSGDEMPVPGKEVTSQAMQIRLKSALQTKTAPIFVSNSVVIATLQSQLADDPTYLDLLLQDWEVYEYQDTTASLSLLIPKKEKKRTLDEFLEGKSFLRLERASQKILQKKPHLQELHTRIERTQSQLKLYKTLIRSHEQKLSPQIPIVALHIERHRRKKATLERKLEALEKTLEESLLRYKIAFLRRFEEKKEAFKKKYTKTKTKILADESGKFELVKRIFLNDEQIACGLKIHDATIFQRRGKPYLEGLVATTAIPFYRILPALKKIFLPNKAVDNGGRWLIFQTGHGYYSIPTLPGFIANMSVVDYQKEIQFFTKKLRLDRLFQSTCYGGSVHAMIPFVEAEKRAVIKPHFPVYHQGTSDVSTFSDEAYVFYFILFEAALKDEDVIQKMFSRFYKENLVFKRTKSGHVFPINTHEGAIDVVSYAKVKSHQRQQTPIVIKPPTIQISRYSWEPNKKLVLLSPAAIPVPIVFEEPNKVEVMSIAPGNFFHIGHSLDFSAYATISGLLPDKQMHPILILKEVFFDLTKTLKSANRKTYLFKTVKFHIKTPPGDIPYLAHVSNNSTIEFRNVMISVTKNNATIYFEWDASEDTYYYTTATIDAKDEKAFFSPPSPITRRNGFEGIFLLSILPESLEYGTGDVGYLEEYPQAEILPRLPGQEDLKKVALLPSNITEENWLEGVSAWDYIWFMAGCYDDEMLERLTLVAQTRLGIPQAKITKADIRAMFDPVIQKQKLIEIIQSKDLEKLRRFRDDIASNLYLLEKMIKQIFEIKLDGEDTTPYVDLFIDAIPPDMILTYPGYSMPDGTRSPDTYDTPLCTSIARNDDYLTKKLIERGIGINIQPKGSDFNPLGLASYFENQRIMKLLLEHPAIENVVIKVKTSEPHKPVVHEPAGEPDENEFEEEKTFEETNYHIFDAALFTCVKLGWPQLAKILIEKGANYRRVFHTGRTLLHIAAMTGHLEVVQLLVKKGLLIRRVDRDRKTPIDWAIIEGHDDVVDFLDAQED